MELKKSKHERGKLKGLFLVPLCAALVGAGLWFGRGNLPLSPLLSEGVEGGETPSKARNNKPGILVQAGGQKWVNKADVNRKMARLHIPFISNQGQTDKRVNFYAHTFGGTVFVTNEGEIVYSLPVFEGKTFAPHPNPFDKAQDRLPPQRGGMGLKSKPDPRRIHRGRNSKLTKVLALKEELVGGKVSIVNGEGEAVTKVSYFKGKDPSKWKSNISTYDMVSLGEVYKGVELKLRAYGNNVEKLFFVKPGAEPQKVRVKLSGGKDIKINENGELEIRTELGTVKFTKPIAYQENKGGKEFVEASYVLNGNEYGFRVGSYDRTKALVIDPLLASTFLGGRSFDFGNSIAIDSGGNVYVTGDTLSSDNLETPEGDEGFPTTPEAFDRSCGTDGNCNATEESPFGFEDVFVSKLSGDLTQLLASTFLGGSDDDFGNSIAIDSGGNVYVTGFTFSPDFSTLNGFDTSCGTDGMCNATDEFPFGLEDAFVSKLKGDLTDLIASTFMGGNGCDSGDSIAIDLSGNVYVTGFTEIVSGASSNFNVLVFKLDENLTDAIASTLGGSDNDFGNSIAIDSGGNVYVAGSTLSPDFPMPNGFDTSCGTDGNCNGGFGDAFVSKLSGDLDLTNPVTTFLGGSDSDSANSIAVDSVGNVYVTGFTFSSDNLETPEEDEGFPTTPEAFDTSCGTDGNCNGGFFEDVFVSRLSGDLTALNASTFLGGRGSDLANSIAADSGGNVYVTGLTESSDNLETPEEDEGFPTTPEAFDRSCGTDGNCNPDEFGILSADAFVSTLKGDLTGPLIVSTFLGGRDSDSASSINIDSNGNVYVTGFTFSPDFPEFLTPNGFDTSCGTDGNCNTLVDEMGITEISDAFISKFEAIADLSITKTDSSDQVTSENNLTYTLTVTNNGPGTATGVTVNDPLPEGVTFVSATSSQGICIGSELENFVTCDLGTLARNTEATVTIEVTPTMVGTISNTAKVSGNELDPNGSNNTDTEDTTVVVLCGGLVAKIIGTAGDDVLPGTGGPDVIHGLGGNDTIMSFGGKDVICGGSGNDTIDGGKAIDRIFGQLGNDTLNGGSGNDSMFGETGRDTMNGGNGEDRMFGGDGGDTLNGGANNDEMFGGSGNDELRGMAGEDTMNGGDGNDKLFGGADDDTLRGGIGADRLDGLEGMDFCNGSPDADPDTAFRCETKVNIP